MPASAATYRSFGICRDAAGSGHGSPQARLRLRVRLDRLKPGLLGRISGFDFNGQMIGRPGVSRWMPASAATYRSFGICRDAAGSGHGSPQARLRLRVRLDRL